MDAKDEKINKFGQILQKFGLDLIQKIGEMKHSLEILTGKIDSIENELIELKGLKTQLHETARYQQATHKEIANIKASIENINSRMGNSAPIEQIQVEPPQELESSKAILLEFEKNLENCSSAGELLKVLSNAKKQIYEITGGHRILLEMREFERRLRPNASLDQSDIKSVLKNKIKDWISQF